MHSAKRHTCRRWRALWLKVRWCDSFSLRGGALWHLRRQTCRCSLFGFCDTSWSRKRHRIFTAPRPPDCGVHQVVWQSITRATTQVYMVPRTLREGKDAAAHVKTACLGAGRMGLSSQGERGRCSLICTHCERTAPLDTFSRRHRRGKSSWLKCCNVPRCIMKRPTAYRNAMSSVVFKECACCSVPWCSSAENVCLPRCLFWMGTYTSYVRSASG